VTQDRDQKWNKGKKRFGGFKGKPHRDEGPFSNTRLKPREEAAPSRPHKPKFQKPSPFKPARKPRPAAPMLESKDKPARDSVFIWGLHAVRAAWLNPKRRCFRLWLTEAGKATFETSITEAKDALLKRPDAKIVDRSELERHTPPGSVHQGILLEVAPLHEPPLHEIIGGDNPPDLLLMLDQVTDPHNVGAILRSAAAFGAGAVIMTERNAPIVTGVQAKAASGATEHVAQIHVVNLARTLDELQQAGYWCVGLAEEGEKELSQLDLSGRTVLVLGNEGEGLRQLTRKKCDELARLPTGGPIGSLNVSNAAAVALYEIRRQKNRF
jgi:23S rRNA (guanosine2251-2'-O)-methyltransferase